MSENKGMKSKYLDQLQYDKKLDDSWFSFFLERSRFLFLLIAIIFIAGFISLRSLPLESSPEVQIWIWTVVTTLPWASPEIIEDLVTKKIEQQISKIKWIDTMTSTSRNSASIITVQFKSNVDIPTVMSELKDKADLAQKDLPTDANDSVVSEISLDDSPIWIFAIAWKYDGFKLYEYAKKIKDELEWNTLISEVQISGWDQTEYRIEYDPKKLESLWLNSDWVNKIISALNFTVPLWEMGVDKYTHTVTIDERYFDIQKLKDLIISKTWNTWIIYLKDVANVFEAPVKRTRISRLSSLWSVPENAATLWVVKKRWWSIVDLVSQWETALEKLKESSIIPKDIQITTILDQSERIKLDQHSLIRDWSITIFLVFMTLFLIIWIKEALVAWISAPLVFLVTFSVMAYAGQTLNFLSMFALILSLWLLVDDAIVVISAINQYKNTWKFTTRESALLVLRDYRNVLISTTLTVVWIFSAMLFMTWIMGKFIFSIPFIITVTLISSLLIALTINPALAVTFDGSGSQKKKSRFSRFFEKWFIKLDRIEIFYENILEKVLKSRKGSIKFLLVIFGVFILSLALPVTWILKNDFFPKTDQDLFFINVEAEPGVKLDVTSELVKPMEERLRKESEVQSFTTTIWTLSSMWAIGWGWSIWWNTASMTVNLVKKEYWRKESSISIAERLRNEFSKIKEIKVTVVELAWWPPAWADFQVQIAWDSFEVMDKISNDYKKILATIPWAINIDTSRKPVPLEFRFSFNSEKLALYDLTLPQVWLFLRNVIDWTKVTNVYKWTDDIAVKTIYNQESSDTLDKIKDLKIMNNRWQYVYLRDILDNKLDSSTSSILRIDQKRIVSVVASASKQTNWAQILAEFNKKTENYKLPSWYELLLGWANEENQKSVESLLVALVFWMFFIIATLVILFDSYKQSVLVLSTIPLSLIWVFVWLVIFGQPLSFPGLIWLVALFWIVVRNWIILFDKINANIKEWIEFKESIIDAVKTRLEPVFLTSICTVLWMIPLTVSNPTWTSLWLSIIFWLTVSTFFTLIVLPTLYFIFIKDRKLRT
ncbi:MAG: acriflavin resistance protein [uncultured bacterium (gcode 4)]|uniref:Acriflavin resistance protein n=1 Tax=uncultured bacterium (gcode 4) TaxID=1234023 RepID=K2FWR7_9BACT|nr:MAG: acriflavin resistance protein [uncultured bacterium (gcode 4)]